jgi:hypothetical protein
MRELAGLVVSVRVEQKNGSRIDDDSFAWNMQQFQFADQQPLIHYAAGSQTKSARRWGR